MAKYLALAAIAFGVALIVAGIRKNGVASFEDGSFIGEIALILFGCAFIGGGSLTLAVLAFINLP